MDISLRAISIDSEMRYSQHAAKVDGYLIIAPAALLEFRTALQLDGS
jgi:hypothetical protein